ncbi:unnamed protein product [Alopecurus aequalis]
MDLRKRPRRQTAGQGMSRGDRLSALLDDVLQHVLSYPPSRDAVKSAVLSRRWRHLWRSTPAVRVKGTDDRFRLFVNTLLLYRDASSPLHSFEIDADLILGHKEHEEADFDPREIDEHVDMWIRYAVRRCRARSLPARFDDEGIKWSPQQPQPFASPHLTTMLLHGVILADDLLDFSCCPALLHLTLSACTLEGNALTSPSLERLSIIGCIADYDSARMRICTPSLRRLQVSDANSSYEGDLEAPSLESMPWLRNASIQLLTSSFSTGNVQMHVRDDDGGAGGSLLLHGLSEATSLELMASHSDTRITLLRDLKWCPTFTKLRTLILNEWCVYADVTDLTCLLRHTPRLESLILQLPFKNRPTLEVKTEGSHITSEWTFLTMEHLKTVEIKNYREFYYFGPGVDFDKRVVEILKLFSDWGIPSSKIRINDYKKSEGKTSTYTQFLCVVFYV